MSYQGSSVRPGQNKRPRGRNNNNGSSGRKGPNPLTRSYESNGPDVKVRGTAQHIAEKYLQLARDAQTSSDPVMAESYLQHAEHYYRLIAAAHAAQQAHLGFRPPAEAEFEEEDDDPASDRFASVAERLPAAQFSAGQPPNHGQSAHTQAVPSQGVSVNLAMQPPEGYQDRQSYQNERNSSERSPQQLERPQNNHQNNHRQNRPDRSYNADRQSGERNERQSGDRGERQGTVTRDNRRFREPRSDYAAEIRPMVDARMQDARPPDFRGQDARQQDHRVPENKSHLARHHDPRMREPRQQERTFEPRVADDFRVASPDTDTAPALPAFITAPPRTGGDIVASAAPELPLDQDETPGFHQRSRRRRRTRAEIESDQNEERLRQAADFAAPVAHESD